MTKIISLLICLLTLQSCFSTTSVSKAVNKDDERAKEFARICQEKKKAQALEKEQKKKTINLNLSGVNFAINSAKLTLKSQEILDHVAKKIIDYNLEGLLEVQGHTSSTGSDQLNMDLSQRRAEAVADYIVKKGVKNPIIAKGYGEEKPIASNRTRKGRLLNRRVVFVWK